MQLIRQLCQLLENQEFHAAMRSSLFKVKSVRDSLTIMYQMVLCPKFHLVFYS